MTLLIFLAAIVVSVMLRHQQRRHVVELNAECERRGLPPPESVPPVPALESVLTVLIGIAFVVPSAAVLAGAFSVGEPREWRPVWEIASVGMAAGVAFLVLGIRSLARLRTSEAKTAGEAPSQS